jgi:hypothetical protein
MNALRFCRIFFANAATSKPELPQNREIANLKTCPNSVHGNESKIGSRWRETDFPIIESTQSACLPPLDHDDELEPGEM